MGDSFSNYKGTINGYFQDTFKHIIISLAYQYQLDDTEYA